ncbi:unnamed protein product [marine sediment metagenome]|uniref:Uncharacterized protein n=1 Tax=marine sediment metagenome TaxID=412755 RepID=X0XBR8_9ZZZZ
MKFKSKLIRLLENHVYYKRSDEDTADKIIELFGTEPQEVKFGKHKKDFWKKKTRLR